ncbi:TonB-dependent receptor [Helicobacter trogontum]|uniref:TonB-dependent receptor n=1 Tax=Helicobacter trogontum TaxID=50960 RepID=A0A4V6HZ26_9HELI|nr:TonB-dependent receptor [Helicobacter trogontum]TLD82832.1 TonB-dependent receptor [Helicobacter trogontum]
MCNVSTCKGSKLILSTTLFGIFFGQVLGAKQIVQDDKLVMPIDSKQSSMDTRVKRLNAVVTSSTGFDLALKNEVKNVLLIDKEGLQNKGFLNINQALQYSPLITFNNNGFGNNIDLRGQGLDANRAVKILVNRVPISLLDTSHGVSPYNNIDIENVERIEVIPGGGAVVYGNGTRGGVINIVTKIPSRDFNRIVLKAISGEYIGLQGGNLSIASGKKLNDKLFLKGDVSVGYTPGVRNTAGIATDKSEIKAFSNDNETNIYTAFQALYNPSENQKFDFNISYSHSWSNIPLSYLSYTSSIRNGPTSTTITKDESTIKNERNMPDEYTIKTQNDSLQTSLNYTTKWSDNLDFDALAFYQFSLTRYIDYKRCLSTKATIAFGCPAGFMDMGKPSGFQNHGAGLNLKAKYATTKNTFIVGLDNVLEASKRINHINHVFPMAFPPLNMKEYTTNITNTAIKLSNSVYVFDSFNYTDQLSLSGGVRLEYSNYWMQNIQDYWQQTTTAQSFEYFNFKDHAQNLSYAAEITPNYQYSDTGNTYAKLELGFISPSAFQMINADPSSSVNSGNNGMLKQNESSGIKPEQYLTAEIGIKDEFDFSYISATLFYTHTFNEIFVNNIAHGTAYTYSNLGQTQRAGAELIAQQSFFDTSWLRLSESIGLLYTNILQTNVANAHLQGKMVPYVPWLKATFNIESDVLRTNILNLTLFFNNTYVSQSFDSTNGTSNTAGQSNVMNKGGYILSDFGAMLSIKDLKINVGVRNLFDSWYVTYQKYPLYAPALGRNYYAELRYAF